MKIKFLTNECLQYYIGMFKGVDQDVKDIIKVIYQRFMDCLQRHDGRHVTEISIIKYLKERLINFSFHINVPYIMV